MITQNLKNKVRKLLEKHEDLRDNDSKLMCVIWYQSLGERIKTMKALELMGLIQAGKVDNFESIRRTRQKLQEHNPELRGKRYNERNQKLEPKVKEQILNFND